MDLNAESIKELWSKTYNTEGKPDWSHILPYYDEDIYFRDSIQELWGMEEFKAMTERLTDRSKDLTMNIVRTAQQDKDIFIEWEMTIKFKKIPIPYCMVPAVLPLMMKEKSLNKGTITISGEIFLTIFQGLERLTGGL